MLDWPPGTADNDLALKETVRKDDLMIIHATLHARIKVEDPSVMKLPSLLVEGSNLCGRDPHAGNTTMTPRPPKHPQR